MPSTAVKCSICQKTLGNDKKREVTTVCGHIFHRECAQQRCNKAKSNDCPICRKKSALHDALSGEKKADHTSAASGASKLNPTTSNDNEENEDEWQCSKCSVNNPMSARRCESCAEPKHSALSDVSATTAATTMANEEWNKQEEAGWQCSKCDYYNEISATICITCRQKNENEHAAKQPNKTLPPVRPSSVSSSFSSNSVSKIYPDLDYDSHSPSQLASDRLPLPQIGSTPTSSEVAHTPIIKLKPLKDKISPSTPPSTLLQPQHQVPVYISDLPLDTEDDDQLASLVRHRVENTLHIEPSDIKCYSKLGVGVMYVSNNQEKDRLLDDVGKLALNPKEGKNIISFIDTLELISYIVFDVTKEKTDLILPTTEEISRRWAELHKGEKLLACNQINIQFPNIYRLVSTSLEQLLNNIHHQDLSINNQFARIYFCADCSFLEDIPRSITQDQLEMAVSGAIKQPQISLSSLYIQINKQAGNACIIAANTARKWSTITYIYLGDRSVPKKDNLTCRLLVHPVPKTFPIQTILKHQELAGKITNYKHSGENLILEISDKHVFDDCVRHGTLRISNKDILHVEAYIASNNPEGSEINADTWYEIEMCKYKPDIMQFVADPKHAIFRYKWNPKIWLEQYQNAIGHKFNGDRKNEKTDQMRHQLQVTVMLNTLATLRKQSYFIENREIKLNLNNNFKTIVYDHQSKLEKSGKMPLKSTPYPKTTVSVVESDCIAAYEKLIKKGRRPVLLNMASATSPGGGYRKGDGAQEENLFRRSDYCRSLDIGLDEFFSQPSERFHCSSNSQLETLSDPNNMYPMNEYGAIYTSGLTFFRHSQDTGYAYMEKPLENVCSIAMAAYRDPKLEGKFLAPKYAVGMRKKIENIFAIAYYHKHDSLVLSALGCGAFRNPPSHVAKLFSSVIDQYAGFFETIVFAIIDDHNAGQRLNPEGNFKPFEEVLDGMSVQPITPMNKPKIMFGPYRILSDDLTVNDVCIFDLIPCNFGAKCTDINNTNHVSQFSHPPLCTYATITGKCDFTNDIVHMVSFIHRNQCKYGGECREIDDKKHSQEYEHPSYCSNGGACHIMEEDHLKQYRHLPLCEDAEKCIRYKKHDQKHCNECRHCKSHCPHGNHCANFHDRKHINELQHPFSNPCPRTPFHCPFYIALSEAFDIGTLSKEIHEHCLEFSHVCRFGRTCTDNTLLHWEKSIHIARHICPYGDKCIKLNQEEHLNSFTHPKNADIRRVCKYADKCHDRRKIEHTIKFRHDISAEESGVVRYYGLNNKINFVQNQMNGMARVINYVKSQNWKPLPSETIPREILDWFRTVRPVHRCSLAIFESILLHGHVMSRDYMENLKKPKFVANSVMQHSRVRRIQELHIPQYEQHAREYITAIVNNEFSKANFPPPAAPPGGGPTPAQPPRPPSASHNNIIKTKEKFLSATIPPNDLIALKEKAIEIAKASIKLHSNPAGIGYASDKELGTAKQVFSILGPHLGHYYGDIFIVFKREILHHPDADFSIQAATSFASGNTYKSRPWLGPDPGSEKQRIELYRNSKLHASIPGYEYALVLELMALTSYMLKSKSMDIDLQTILKCWMKNDSHQNVEAHLPQLIPLDYIDHIYIPKSIFDSLNANTRRAIDAVFKYSITVTSNQVEVDPAMGSFGPVPTSKERAEYQDYVLQQLLKQYGHDISYPPARPIRGACITIPGNDFTESFLLPLRISQAYEQYRIDHKQPPTENITYIYWQAINGDMMLVLSNEAIDSEKHQTNLRCLMCYIAPKCTSYDTNYHEQTTYLNCGQPVQHHAFVSKNQYKAKSDTFHIGCNTDDFITYCLEIHRSTGKVILRHAGSNSIYNHQEISCQFNKTELDLTKLDFIHVTAGSKEVSIRNLMVYFEKQMDLHPTFDKDFKKDLSTIPKTSISRDNSHDSSSLEPCHDNVNCLLQYAKSASGSTHISKYSHPCRFSELCRNKEPHLTHDAHPSPLCNYDKNCYKLIDPFHRAEYRHTNLPDFLIPCRDQIKCQNKSNQHRIEYSHGEQVYEKKPIATSGDLIPCKWGSQCKIMGDPKHTEKYSHPKSD